MIRGQRKRQKGEREGGRRGGERERKKRARDPAERGSEQEVTFPFLARLPLGASPPSLSVLIIISGVAFSLTGAENRGEREGREGGWLRREGGRADINDRRKV